MAVYSITYDLYTPGQKHEQIGRLLEQYNAVKIARTYWLIESNNDTESVRNIIKPYIDANDVCFAARISIQNWAGFNLPANVVRWLENPNRSW